MNGATAFAGYIYQQEFVAFSLLASEAGRLLVIDRSCIQAFAIEGRTTDAGPAWDVRFERENGNVELLECKDTSITRDDRITFYRRVRSEIAAGTLPEALAVGWVTDPTKQGDILDHLEQMRSLAESDSDIDWSGGEDVRVSSGKTALMEALYRLCATEADSTTPPLEVDVARTLLSRLQTYRYTNHDLSESVKLLAVGLFDSGAGEAIHAYILGDLTSKIVSAGFVRYARTEFLATIGTAPLALTAADAFRDLLDFHSAAGGHQEVPRITWQRLANRPTRTWPLTERLPGVSADESLVIIADTGVGKTATSWQLFEARREDYDDYHVLRLDAGGIEDSIVRLLPRLLCILCGVSRTWIVIDGLDEITPGSATLWRQTVNRLLALAKCTVVLTVRKEVLSAYDWMQQLTDSFAHAILQPLSEAQVADAFQAVSLPVPESSALLQCLRNPFLLSLYAQMASPAELPLRTSGEATGFHVIEQYWNRRVVAESQGLRGGMATTSTAHQKRCAVAYLQTRMLNGDLIVSRNHLTSDVAAGLAALQCEGVLKAHSTNAITWSHDWLYQYALIDKLIEGRADQSPETLAELIGAITPDHVRRTACIGATKWAILHAEWGPIDRLLIALHQVGSHLPSGALPIIVEGPTRFIALTRLPVALIIEFIEIAIHLHATHWTDSIVNLPEDLFAGPSGQALLDGVVRFTQKVVLNG